MRRHLTTAVALMAALVSSVSAQSALSARARIDAAIAAMGGEARLNALSSLKLETIGHDYALEQSERPEGPWLTTYTDTTEYRDLAHSARRIESRRRNWSFPQWSPATALVINGDAAARTNGQRWAPGRAADLTASASAMALAPERLLITARAAADLRSLPDEVQQKVSQHVVAFTFEGQRMRLFLNAWTSLPTMLEITKEGTFGEWGDVTERRWYSFWTLEKGSLMYPRQTTTEWNGYPYQDETVQGLTVDEPIDPALVTIPDDVKAAYAKAAAAPPPPSPVAFDGSRAIAITDWLVEVPSGYNTSVVKQPDGLVILEATTSEAHANAVMAFAKSRFPGLPIKAVITTSDAWPHLSGVRAYVAAGVPIYALDLNESILSRFVKAPHTLRPDALQKSPKPAKFTLVSKKTVIGTGDTRIELYPVRGEIGERMMLAWFPGAKTLYSSDLIQRNRPNAPTPFFMPLMLMEVERTATREGLTGIDQVFGMHLTPTKWSEIIAAIDAARKN
jgi:hypothetical protein